jgi:hypothetical protein
VRPTAGADGRFARALARLDSESFAAFVAAVHEARPDVDTVDLDGGCLVVRGREEHRLRLVVDRGWLRGSGPVGPANGPVDAVVTQVAGAGRRTAVTHDARLVGPDDLRDRVCYGLSRPDADRLLDDHLGIDRAAALSEESGRSPLAAGLALVLAVGLVAVALGTAGAGPQPGIVAQTPTPTPDGPAPTTATGAGAGLPAGLSPVGVTSAGALARAHEDALGERYAFSVEARNLPALGGPGAWSELEANAVVAGPRTYRGSVGGVRTTDDGGWWVLSRIYADGDRLYERRYGQHTPVYHVRPAPADGPVMDVRPAPADGPVMDRGAEDLRRYLAVRSAPGGNVTPAEVEGEWGHRVSVARAPPGVDAETYLAVARVTDAGRVARLEVEYVRPDGEQTTLVARYEPTNETVEAPDWVDEARRTAAEEERASESGRDDGASRADGGRD